jgi:RNA polymerase sigma-70 factor, ECF subfamily
MVRGKSFSGGRGGSAAAVPTFDELYLDYAPYVEALSRRLCGNQAQAEDLFQEVFLRIHRFLPDYNGGSIKGWIRRITVNSFYSSMRGRREELLEDVEPEFHEIPDSGLSTSADVVRRQQRNRIDEAIRRLPDDARRVVELRDYEALEYQEIADRLEIPVGTVRSRLNRAREALRRSLKDEL